MDISILNGKIGMMPLVAPYIREKELEIKKLKAFINKGALIDCDTIVVEGLSDKLLLEKAINIYSSKISDMIKNNELRIITKEDGCGTTLLKDWATAWSYSGFKSKLIIVADNDLEGRNLIDTLKKFVEENGKKRAGNILTNKLQPSDEILELNRALGNKHMGICYEVEHLLAISYWRKMIERNWCVPREQSEIIDAFKEKMTFSDGVEVLLNKLSVSDEIKNSILKNNPNEGKKIGIAEMAIELYEKGECPEMFVGFKRTIEKLEQRWK